METIFQLIAILAVVVGTLFSVVGVVGFIRLPDVYTRLVAAVVGEPLGWGRGLVLISLLMITGPATAHALGSAAHRIGLPREGAVRDDLVHASKSKP
jgi:multicomponent Na+:H+ antiporter subunit G